MFAETAVLFCCVPVSAFVLLMYTFELYGSCNFICDPIIRKCIMAFFYWSIATSSHFDLSGKEAIELVMYMKKVESFP